MARLGDGVPDGEIRQDGDRAESTEGTGGEGRFPAASSLRPYPPTHPQAWLPRPLGPPSFLSLCPARWLRQGLESSSPAVRASPPVGGWGGGLTSGWGAERGAIRRAPPRDQAAPSWPRRLPCQPSARPPGGNVRLEATPSGGGSSRARAPCQGRRVPAEPASPPPPATHGHTSPPPPAPHPTPCAVTNPPQARFLPSIQPEEKNKNK
uniref:basic salivary proline-rich protein 3-like n=1 Tax=Jaculus jaculus TaxID=51337 RepID=UPI00064D10AA|nr:basic salivary proline-rich protein 3-like [Jaculus jaculus]